MGLLGQEGLVAVEAQAALVLVSLGVDDRVLPPLLVRMVVVDVCRPSVTVPGPLWWWCRRSGRRRRFRRWRGRGRGRTSLLWAMLSVPGAWWWWRRRRTSGLLATKPMLAHGWWARSCR